MEKQKSILVFGALILLLSFGIFSAAEIISPATGTNHTTTTILFNVSYTNATATNITSPVNATFFYNLSGTWTAIGNTTPSGGCTVDSCFVTLNISSLPDGIYSVNATLYNATGSASAVIITDVINFDSKAPEISTSNITPVSYTNNTDYVNFTASIAEIGVWGNSNVLFSLVYPNGTHNQNITASYDSTNSYWSAAVLTSTNFTVDGYYNVTVYVNDSGFRINNTAQVYSVLFDNTNPSSATLSCSPTTLSRGATISCTCTGVDGVGIGSATFNQSPSTSTSGTFTENCVVTDFVGNYLAATAVSYTVTGSSSGGSSSSGSSSSWTSTYVSEANTVGDSDTRDLAAKSRLRLKVNNIEHHVGVLSLTQTTATIEVSSDPQQATLSVGETRRFDVNGDDVADISVTLNSIENSRANTTVSLISEQLTDEEIEQNAQQPTTETGNENGSEEGSSSNWWIVLVVVLVILAAIGFYFSRRR